MQLRCIHLSHVFPTLLAKYLKQIITTVLKFRKLVFNRDVFYQTIMSQL